VPRPAIKWVALPPVLHGTAGIAKLRLGKNGHPVQVTEDLFQLQKGGVPHQIEDIHHNPNYTTIYHIMSIDFI
jgi:hypothetical protein